MIKKFMSLLLVSGTIFALSTPAVPASAYYILSDSQKLGQTVETNGQEEGWYKFSDGTWGYYCNYGELAKNVKLELNGSIYGLDENGKMVTGWFNNYYDDQWYFFQSDGRAAKGWLQTDGYWYYFDNNCAMQTGWQKINLKWYYFDPSTGQMATNILVDGYFLTADGSLQ